MKLFQMEVRRGRDGQVLLAHFPSEEEAVQHVKKKMADWQIRRVIEITQPAHFQVADWE